MLAAKGMRFPIDIILVCIRCIKLTFADQFEELASVPSNTTFISG